jgi:hypothetical protein
VRLLVLVPLLLLACSAGEEFMGIDMSMGDWMCDHEESAIESYPEDAIWQVTGDPEAKIGEPGSCDPVRCLYAPAGTDVAIYLPRSRDKMSFTLKVWPPEDDAACIPE